VTWLEARIARMVREAEAELYADTLAACPGPHAAIQHKDAKPPWCPLCGCSDNGVPWRNLTPPRPRPCAGWDSCPNPAHH